MKYRCAYGNMHTIGARTTTIAANCMFFGWMCPSIMASMRGSSASNRWCSVSSITTSRRRIICNGCRSGSVRYISASNHRFQCVTIVNNANVASSAVDIGSTMRKRIVKSFAPSMYADSRSDSG